MLASLLLSLLVSNKQIFPFVSGYNLLRDPHHNKALAFSEKERDAHYLRGLLPPIVVSQDLQVSYTLLIILLTTFYMPPSCAFPFRVYHIRHLFCDWKMSGEEANAQPPPVPSPTAKVHGNDGSSSEFMFLPSWRDSSFPLRIVFMCFPYLALYMIKRPNGTGYLKFFSLMCFLSLYVLFLHTWPILTHLKIRGSCFFSTL